jgi:hypothetical protein
VFTLTRPSRSGQRVPQRTVSALFSLVVFGDPTVAAQQTKDHAQDFSKYVVGARQPFAVETNGLKMVGMSPESSKAATYLTFVK